MGGEGMPSTPRAGEPGAPLAGERPGDGEGDGDGDGDAELGDAAMCASPVCPSPMCAACCSASLPLRVSTCTTSDFGRENEDVRDDAVMLRRRG